MSARTPAQPTFDDRPRIGERAAEGIGIEGYCAGCKSDRYWSPTEAVETFGADTVIKVAELRLRCPCGATGRSRPGIELRGSIKDFYAKCARDRAERDARLYPKRAP